MDKACLSDIAECCLLALSALVRMSVSARDQLTKVGFRMATGWRCFGRGL